MGIEVLNPSECISNILEDMGYGKGLEVDHICYDESVNEDFQYIVGNESTHDGTLIFTNKLIKDTLIRLISKQLYYRDTMTDEEFVNLKDVEYIVGDMKLETQRGVRASFGTGIKQLVRIPVRVNYVYK
jgi:hypothetical protein